MAFPLFESRITTLLGGEAGEERGDCDRLPVRPAIVIVESAHRITLGKVGAAEVSSSCKITYWGIKRKPNSTNGSTKLQQSDCNVLSTQDGCLRKGGLFL